MQRHWKREGRNLSPIHDLKPLIARTKRTKRSKKYEWLKHYDSMALQESLPHLDAAIKRATTVRITLSADTTGAYYASVLYEDGQAQAQPPVKICEDKAVGIDLGLKDLGIESGGRKEPNPKHLKQAEKNLRRKAKKFSRTKKGSRWHEKARKRLAKAHKRISNAREDNLHNNCRMREPTPQ